MADPSIHARLHADHDDLDARLDALVAAFKTGDWSVGGDAFRSFEGHLIKHFEVEEKLLFPEFAITHPAEVEELRAEHAAIRARVEELDVGVELHQARLPVIQDLVQTLRRHAAREDAVLYKWADRAFSDPVHLLRFEGVFTHGRSPEAPVL
jgi:hemerythrin-like domain-containing protein